LKTDESKDKSQERVYPLLPVRNIVVFPNTIAALMVGRPKSLLALSEAKKSAEKQIVVVTQKSETQNDVMGSDLYTVGTLCKIEKMMDGGPLGTQVLVRGYERFKIEECIDHDYFKSKGVFSPDQYRPDELARDASINVLKKNLKSLLDYMRETSEELSQVIEKIKDPSQFVNLLGFHLGLSIEQAQALLEEVVVDKRINRLLDIVRKKLELLKIENEIHSRVSSKFSAERKRIILKEQLKTIHEQLGEEGDDAVDELENKLTDADLPENVKKIIERELRRLKGMSPGGSEYHVILTYLDWISELPWNNRSEELINLENAKSILDEDHYGLEEIKKRIFQYLVVAKLKNDQNGPILCFVGPPGVGKTSLGKSIARALNREFTRASLGGVNDVAEISGHRRTYIGAMPGKIIQCIKRLETKNPVMMLDEIDKLTSSFRGDPASALLEVLDPEQNKEYMDHYIDVPFDLSEVFFITTANTLETIPGPLLDRMEVIELTSYTIEEKLKITNKYLLPQVISEHGLTNSNVSLNDEGIHKIVASYTKEAGVRNLKRVLSKLMRSVAEKVLVNNRQKVILDTKEIIKILGPEKYLEEMMERKNKPGVATGLAWTPFGGEILFIESTSMKGSGELILTGQLGDIMKESAKIALSLVRTMAPKWNLNYTFKENDIHVHVPAGALPKDGPSAGLAIFTSLVSLLIDKKLDTKTAMTGEVTWFYP
jgi:ATP-dependent Lon protease